MEMSPEQVQAMLNEAWSMSVSEDREKHGGMDLATWAGREDRWRLPVPELATDPAEPETHESPLGAISWIFPPPVQAMAPPRFWLLLDRLWGVSQADDLPMKIDVREVSWPEGPSRPPRVEFSESSLSWGAKLLSMMIEVREEMETMMPPEMAGSTDRLIQNFQAQVQRVAQLPSEQRLEE